MGIYPLKMAASLGKHARSLPKILSTQMGRRLSTQPKVFVDSHAFDPHNLYPMPTEGLAGLTDPVEIEAIKKLDPNGYIEHYFGTCEKTPTQEQIDHVKHDAPKDRYVEDDAPEEWGLNIWTMVIFTQSFLATLYGIGMP